MFQTKVVEKIEIHILCSINNAICDIMWKNFRVGQATDGNMIHVHCMLHAQGYKYTQVV
jgi:hypothetical protein